MNESAEVMKRKYKCPDGESHIRRSTELDALIGFYLIKIKNHNDSLLIWASPKSLFIDDGEYKYKFLFTYETKAECCSETWIERIEDYRKSERFCMIVDVKELLEDVLEVESSDMFEHEVTEVYGYQIITNTGFIEIDFRNKSNGYYGGSLELDTLTVHLGDIPQ